MATLLEEYLSRTEQPKIEDLKILCRMPDSYIIYPVHKNRLFAFLFRKTHLKCFLECWECNGVKYPKDYPLCAIKSKHDQKKQVKFYKYKPLDNNKE